MPIYEYQCDGCADRFEVKQSMKDDPITICSKCGKRVQRLISSPAIMFKGSGWYVTDYSDKMKPSAGNEAPTATTGEKKGAAPSTSENAAAATTPTTPAPPSTATPASTSSSTTSSASTTTTATPSSPTAK